MACTREVSRTFHAAAAVVVVIGPNEVGATVAAVSGDLDDDAVVAAVAVEEEDARSGHIGSAVRAVRIRGTRPHDGG